MSGAEATAPAPVRSIGVPMPLVDGPEKVSGKALYTADFIAREELTGRILRSPVAHARIVEHRRLRRPRRCRASTPWSPAGTAPTASASSPSR